MSTLYWHILKFKSLMLKHFSKLWGWFSFLKLNLFFLYKLFYNFYALYSTLTIRNLFKIYHFYEFKSWVHGGKKCKNLTWASVGFNKNITGEWKYGLKLNVCHVKKVYAEQINSVYKWRCILKTLTVKPVELSFQI